MHQRNAETSQDRVQRRIGFRCADLLLPIVPELVPVDEEVFGLGLHRTELLPTAAALKVNCITPRTYVRNVKFPRRRLTVAAGSKSHVAVFKLEGVKRI